MASVDSASDQRTANNVMRHEYRVLTDAEKAQMKRIKDLGVLFATDLHEIGGTLGNRGPDGKTLDRHASRELSLAQTKIEEAVMWAVKHITR